MGHSSESAAVAMSSNMSTSNTLVKFHSSSTPNMAGSGSGSDGSGSGSVTGSKVVKRATAILNRYHLIPGENCSSNGPPPSPCSGGSNSFHSGSKNSESCSNLRPPFVTTVTRGKFLPSKFDLMIAEKSLFTFSSRPRPVGLVVAKHDCSLTTGRGPLKEHNPNTIPPRGAHDYYNMMYDPHIYRGRATTSTATIPPTSKNQLGQNNINNENKAVGGELGTGESRITRKKRTVTLNSNGLTGSGGGNSRSGFRYKTTTRVTTRTSSKALLKLADRSHTHVQTEHFLQDLSADESPEERDAVVQTEPIHDLKCGNSDKAKKSGTRLSPPFKSGVDAGTQVLPGELFSFDEEVQPLVDTLVEKILHQALLETMEEEEIAGLQEQRRIFLEKRKHEESLLKQLQNEQRKFSEEKERLKLELNGERNTNSNRSSPPNEPHPYPSSPQELLSIQDRVILDQAIRSAAKNQPNVSTSYLIELLPSVLNSLRQEGYLTDTIGDGDIFSNFLPMCQSYSKAESEMGEPFTGENSGCGSAGRSASASVEQEDAIKPNFPINLQLNFDKPESDETENEQDNNVNLFSNMRSENDIEDDIDPDYDPTQDNYSNLTNATYSRITPLDDLDLDFYQPNTTSDSELDHEKVETASSSATPPIATIKNKVPSFDRNDGTSTAIEG